MDNSIKNVNEIRLALISMPFTSAHSPSPALGLLQALAEENGFIAKTFYTGLSFANKVGIKDYTNISNGFPSTTAMAGEWVFSSFVNEKSIPAKEFLEKTSSLSQNKLNLFSDTITNIKSIVPDFLDETYDEIIAWEPTIIGFTFVFQQTFANLALAKLFKQKNPNIIIIGGGANCEKPMGQTLLACYPWLDYVISGEGESPLIYLLNSLSKKVSINHPRILDRSKGINKLNCISNVNELVNLDRLPFPNYKDYFNEISKLKLQIEPRVPFETSRGCWWGQKHHCTFCGLNSTTMAFRKKNPERALKEILYLIKAYPTKYLSAVDNIIDMQYFNSLLPNLIGIQGDVEFFYEVKSNLNRKQLQLLYDARVFTIQPGIESLSTNVLKIMRKGTTGLKNLQMLKNCEEIGIKPEWNFLWGFPSELKEDYTEQAYFASKVTHLPPPSGGAKIRLDRFSPNYDYHKDLGVENIRPVISYKLLHCSATNKQIRDLAYYFDFDYTNNLKPDEYTSQLKIAIDNWVNHYEMSILIFVDTNDKLLIWDTRKISSNPLLVLSGALRKVALESITTMNENKISVNLNLDLIVVKLIISTLVNLNLILRIDRKILFLPLNIETSNLTKNKQLVFAKLINKIKGDKSTIKLHNHEVDQWWLYDEWLKDCYKYLIDIGTDSSTHSGRMLIDHLYGTYTLLFNENIDTNIKKASLFHSIINYYKENNLDSLSSKSKLLAIVGKNVFDIICKYNKSSKHKKDVCWLPESKIKTEIEEASRMDQIEILRWANQQELLSQGVIFS